MSVSTSIIGSWYIVTVIKQILPFSETKFLRKFTIYDNISN
jgi:hypothetical protein